MARFRDLGFTVGRLPVGGHNSITDVPGVRVGHTTLIDGDGATARRTGVTVILPHAGNLFREKVGAAVFTINGHGKAAGLEQIRELGTLESPIALTNTLNVPRVADALLSNALARNPEIGASAGTVNVVVGECNDGYLNDIRARAVDESHVLAALEAASDGPVAEGNVGGGTGTTCGGFKAGIGSAARRVDEGRYTLGALVQTNFGSRQDLTVLGMPVGRELADILTPGTPAGSIMIVLATDAPLNSAQLANIGARASFGLARLGTVSPVGSGDFVIAFSTSTRFPHGPDPEPVLLPRLWNAGIMNDLYRAVAETVEEAVLNSLIAAETMTGRDGRTVHALPHARLIEILARAHPREG